jgi:hypothetical protein
MPYIKSPSSLRKNRTNDARRDYIINITCQDTRQLLINITCQDTRQLLINRRKEKDFRRNVILVL